MFFPSGWFLGALLLNQSRAFTPSLTKRRDTRLFNASDDPEILKSQAAALRKQVNALEEEKNQVARAESAKEEEERKARNERRERYSAEVPILKPDGSTRVERCDFSPVLPENESFIITCEVPVPLGILLGEHEEYAGVVIVDEVASGSNGESAGIREGDLLRACTACRFEMEQPTWQLIAGGVGRPSNKRYMYSVDGRPFEEVLDAVGSNRLDERPALIVLERREDA